MESHQEGSVSIKRELGGATILLTGATGYVGSVVLEQLLRCSSVRRVYCLLRAKKGSPAQARLHSLLKTNPLFHLVRDTPAANRAAAVEGDISLPGLGLDPETRAMLEAESQYIIHCAADIALEADIQDTLRHNVEGTRSLLQLALGCRNLRSVVHTSSAYVNLHFPHSSFVEEAIYPLMHDGMEVDAEELVQELMSADNAAANIRAHEYLNCWGFPNTYTFGKHLGEKVVRNFQRAHGLPIAIVRPSLISCIALAPLPGYCGNLAGPNGTCAALATGFYNSIRAVPFQPHRRWDVVAADFVAGTIISAAVVTGANQLSSSAAAQAADVHEIDDMLTCKHRLQTVTAYDAVSKGIKLDQKCCKVPQLHISTNASSSSSDGEDSSSPIRPKLGRPSLDDALPQGPHAAAAAQFDSDLPIYHAVGGMLSTSFQEGWAYMLGFVQDHPPPFRLTWGLPGEITDDYQPNKLVVQLNMKWTAAKVRMAVFLLRMFGMERPAMALSNGLSSFELLNNDKLDKDLTFATQGQDALAAMVDPQDAADFPVVWKPMTHDGKLMTDWETLSPAQKEQCVGKLSPKKYTRLMMAGVYRKMFKVTIKE